MFSNASHVASALEKRAGAKDQGGLLSGHDPTQFSTDHPIRLWIIQLGVIIALTQLLALGLRRMRQPKVIAEVLGGILLGPTALGAIPGFTEHIFPEESTHFLALTANIGLCLFLFLVGLEIDLEIIKRNARLSAAISLAGMIVPFGLGAGIAVPIYREFVDKDIEFTHFMLFTCVAYSITAFPVLCRILTELKLLDTTVGIVVLSAGVGNDIVGWVLLALTVALVNAGSGLTALYILLVCVAWTLVILFAGKWVMRYVGRKTGSLETGHPTMIFMTCMFVLVFGSAFFTDIIGVHAIFGAFLAGLVIPRDNGLTIHLAEKFEDMVAIIFLPLYFTLSGLSTNLRLLDNGITWGYTICICVTAFISKFFACALTARYAAGFNWRESGAVGSLMSCKGLVELIVLNVGLSAGILSQRVFSMFVLEALVLTFATTPLVTWMYPPHVRKHVAATGANFDAVAGDAEHKHRPSVGSGSTDASTKKDFMVVIDRTEHIPAVMAVSQFIQPSQSSSNRAPSNGKSTSNDSDISLFGLRLMELSDRTSAVMKSSISPSLLFTDPLLAIFRMFARLNGILESNLRTSLEIVPYDGLVDSVVENAEARGVDMVLLPLIIHTPTAAGKDADDAEHPRGSVQHKPTTSGHNPFEHLLRLPNMNPYHAPVHGDNGGAIRSHIIRGIFARSKIDVALYIDLTAVPGLSASEHASAGHRRSMSKASHAGVDGGFSAIGDKARHHVFVPFFGGPDDRLAVSFVVGLCAQNENMSATIIRFVKEDHPTISHGDALRPPESVHVRTPVNEKTEAQAHQSIGHAHVQDTVYAHHNTETRLLSDTADNLLWASLAPANVPVVNAHSSTSLPPPTTQLQFQEVYTTQPLHDFTRMSRSAARHAKTYNNPSGVSTRTLIVAGRSRRMAVENHDKELKVMMQDAHGSAGGDQHVDADVRKTVGDVASASILKTVGSGGAGVCGVVVVQSAQAHGA